MYTTKYKNYTIACYIQTYKNAYSKKTLISKCVAIAQNDEVLIQTDYDINMPTKAIIKRTKQYINNCLKHFGDVC